MRTLIFIVSFFLIGALFIIGNNNLEMYKDENFQQFGSLYVGWLVNTFHNLQQVTGEAIKLDWLSNEIINSSNK